MPAVLLALPLLCAAVASLWAAVALTEAALDTVSHLDPTAWRQGADELRAAADRLVDALDEPERR